ncbi:MAG: hypothetical protein LBL37_03695 [Gracilibacteraceae bacterium]|jgi:hypothetical protein|nr:hypothetical protein [Gracilibacteraceae bacterium]
MPENSLDNRSVLKLTYCKKYIVYYKSDYSLSAVIEAPSKAKAKKIFANTHLPGIEITAIREAALV